MACRTARPKADLRRIVRTPDGHVVVDATGRLPGRGAYLCADPACLERAMKTGALARALKTPLPSELLAGLAAGTQPDMTIEGGARGQE